MKRYAFVTLVMLCSAASLEAQATMVLPDKPLPPEHARIQAAAYVLRDTLFAVTGAAARLHRDFRHTSDASLMSRAREIADACAASGRNVAAPRTVLGETPTTSRLQETEKKRLLGAFDDLASAAAKCASRFVELAKPDKGDEVRGYGNRDAQAMVAEIRRYEAALDGYFRAMRIPNRPRGARPNPLAG
ncbi:MAG TPA: hypothetical protein VFT04_11585 [Gemmatimonadales bacterium]|nr:hypothetical protein [Gemmatimonadales bacterium]